jgi:hypothetical protein
MTATGEKPMALDRRPACSSGEAPVIGVERRGRVLRGLFTVVNRVSGRNRVDELKSSGKPFDISRWEVWEAYRQVKANKGAPGWMSARSPTSSRICGATCTRSGIGVCPASCDGLAGESPAGVVAKQPRSWWPAEGEIRPLKRHDKVALGGEQVSGPYDEES